MSLRNLLRKMLLALALGGHEVFGVGMSKEQIERLLFAMNGTLVEMAVAEEDLDPLLQQLNRSVAKRSSDRASPDKIKPRSTSLFMGLRKTKSVKHKGKRLTEILAAHELFFRGKDGGARADLEGADLSHADLQGVNFSGAILRGANLEGSDLKKAKLPGADLSGARLRKADLRNTDMTEAILPGADLTEAQASGVEFFRCDLSNACFQRARLRNVNLRGAKVNGASFAGADMGTAILRETDLTGADLTGVDLSTTLMPRNYTPQKSQGKGA